MNQLNRRTLMQTPALLAAAAPFGLSGLLLAPANSHAQIASLPDAIEKGEALFMLSQRAAKAYFAIGLEVRKQEAQKVLDSSVQRFDRLIIEQKAFAPTAAIRKTYTDLGAAWVDLKIELIGKVPSKAGALIIVKLNEAVFELSGQGTNQLQVAAKTPNSKLLLPRSASRLRVIFLPAAGWSPRIALLTPAASTPRLPRGGDCIFPARLHTRTPGWRPSPMAICPLSRITATDSARSPVRRISKQP